MDRNMGRQGSMAMSPGMMRRPAGMQTGSSRGEMHLSATHNHSAVSSSPSYQSQQQQQQQQQQSNHGAAGAGSGLNNGAPSSSTSPAAAMGSSSAALQPNHHQQSQSQHSQHDELIRYINEAWTSITTDKSQTPPVFYKSGAETRLPGFTPFDLEGWWGQRLVHQINLGSHGHQ
uniref:Putative e3 ubiquitin-protein ligase trim33 n=3 Tax=Anopheles triannulatus TaxID=58253 RepID=A0A2M4ANZ0_9DIPT